MNELESLRSEIQRLLAENSALQARCDQLAKELSPLQAELSSLKAAQKSVDALVAAKLVEFGIVDNPGAGRSVAGKRNLTAECLAARGLPADTQVKLTGPLPKQNP